MFTLSEDDLFCFDIWICPDSLPYVEGIKTRAQFFFSVTGMPAQSSVEVRRTLRFRVRNMSTQGKLLSFGHKPVALRLDKKSYGDMIAGKSPVYNQDWNHLKLNYLKSEW